MTLSRITVGMFAALACSVLQAQTTDLRAKIPFDFQLGQKVMPAGDYQILNQSNGLVVVREVGGRYMTYMSLTLPVSRPDAPSTGKLVFSRYGNTYFLSDVWAPNSHDGRALPKSRQEKELASRAAPIHPEEVTVARR